MRNIHFYNASAGSGKTYKIAQLIVDSIRNGHLDPSSIIATTFTNDAAAELKERIRKTLIRENCFTEAIALKSALIGTINSIGGQLLEKYSLQAGLPPGLKVIEESHVDGIIERLIANRIGPEFPELAYKMSQLDEGDFKKQIAKIVNLSRINNLNDKTIRESGENSFRENAALFGENNEGNSFTRKIEMLLPAMKEFIVNIEGDPDLYRKTDKGKRLNLYGNLDKLLENLKDFCRQSGPHDSNWYERFRLLDLGQNKLPSTRNYHEQFFSLYEKYYPLYTCKEFHEDLEQYFRQVFEIAIQVREDFAKYKSERGLIDFTDQEHRLLMLLKKDDLVRNDLSKQYSMFVVDEFQDTSPVQLALFVEINKLVKQTVWVGDPKQSIYGFRGADMALVNSVIGEIDKKTGGNESTPLPFSYRSRKDLVYLSNALFSKPFREVNHMPAERTCLKICDSRTNTPAALKGAFQLWKFSSGRNGYNKDFYSNLAKKVVGVISEGWPMVIKGKEKEGITTQAKGKDIALLFHTNNECRKMAAALIELGIRVCSRSTGLFSEPESRLLTAVLKVAANRTDSLAVAEVMLFETFNGSQEQLLNSRLRKIKETGDLPAALTDWEESESTWIWLIANSGFRLSNFSLYDKACWLAGELGIHQFTAGWPNPGQRTANIEQYLKFLKQYEDLCTSSGEQSGIHGFIRFASRLEDTKKDELGIFTDENTVTISTFHGAKGLEWPMVIITDVAFNYKPGSHFYDTRVTPALRFDPADPLSGRTISLWLKPFHNSANVKEERSAEYMKELWNPPRGQAGTLKQLDNDRPQLHEVTDAFRQFTGQEAQEDLRKFYVAFTRARDYTVLTYCKDSRYKFWQKLGKALETADGHEFTEKWADELTAGIHDTPFEDVFDGQNVTVHLDVVECFPAGMDAHPGLNTGVQLKQISLRERQDKYEKAFVSPSALEKAVQAEPAKLVQRFSGKLVLMQKPSDELGADFGNCLHHYFTAALHAEPENYQELAVRVLTNHRFENHLNPDQLAGYTKEFYGWIRAFDPDRIDSELPVRYMTEKGQLYSGSIDLLVTRNDSIMVIDHKTFAPSDTIEEENLGALVSARFSSQLNTYSEMLGSTGTYISDLLIHLPVLGMVFRISKVIEK